MGGEPLSMSAARRQPHANSAQAGKGAPQCWYGGLAHHHRQTRLMRKQGVRRAKHTNIQHTTHKQGGRHAKQAGMCRGRVLTLDCSPTKSSTHSMSDWMFFSMKGMTDSWRRSKSLAVARLSCSSSATSACARGEFWTCAGEGGWGKGGAS